MRLALRIAVTAIYCFPLAYSPSSRATHTGSLALGGGNMSAPINTETAVPIPQGHFAGGLRSEFVKIDRMSQAQALRLHEQDETADLHSVESLLSSSLGFAYGVTDNLTVGLRLPYLWRENISEPEDGEIARLGDANGLGDLVGFGQYRFFHDPVRNIHASALFGVKMPTGRTHRFADTGEIIEAEQQPGSGSWDGIAGLSYTQQIFERVTFNASTVYTIVTKGTQRTDLGDAFSYNAALSYRTTAGSGNTEGGDYFFLPQGSYALDLVMELNGQWRDLQSVRGQSVANSGGHQLYLSPGVRLTAGQHWNMGVSFGVPVVEHFNSHQDELDYRAVGTLSFYY